MHPWIMVVTCENKQKHMYSNDIRWRMVQKRKVLNTSDTHFKHVHTSYSLFCRVYANPCNSVSILFWTCTVGIFHILFQFCFSLEIVRQCAYCAELYSRKTINFSITTSVTSKDSVLVQQSCILLTHHSSCICNNDYVI